LEDRERDSRIKLWQISEECNMKMGSGDLASRGMAALSFRIPQTGLDILSTAELSIHNSVFVKRVWFLVVCIRAVANKKNQTSYFSSKQLLSCTHEADWTPFRTHYFSENLVASGIEPGSGSVARNPDH
jgi:hypothetical protein